MLHHETNRLQPVSVFLSQDKSDGARETGGWGTHHPPRGSLLPLRPFLLALVENERHNNLSDPLEAVLEILRWTPIGIRGGRSQHPQSNGSDLLSYCSGRGSLLCDCCGERPTRRLSLSKQARLLASFLRERFIRILVEHLHSLHVLVLTSLRVLTVSGGLKNKW